MKKSKNQKSQKSHFDISSLSDKVFRGILWAGSKTIIIYVVRCITLVIFARLLKPEDFGIITAIMTIVNFLIIFCHSWVVPFIVRCPTLELIHIRVSFTLSLLFGVNFSILTWIIAPAIAYFLRMENTLIFIKILSLTFTLSGLSIVSKALLYREMRFESLAMIEVLSYATGYIGVGIPLAVFGFGAWALAGAYLTEVLISSISALLLRPHDFRPAIDKASIRQLLEFGGGYVFTRIANYISTQGDKLIIGRYLGAHQLGIYGRAYYLVGIVSSLVEGAVGRVLFAAMARLQHDQERLRLVYLRSISLINLILCPGTIVSMIIAPELIDLLLGNQWHETVTPFRLLAMGMWCGALYEISHYLVMVKGSVHLLGSIQSLYAGLVIVGALVGLYWGVSGVAGGVMISIVVNTLLIITLSLKLTKTTWYTILDTFVPAIVSGCTLGLCSWIISQILRSLHFSSITILLAVGLNYLLIWSLFWRISPNLFFGSIGNEVMRIIVSKISPQMQSILHFLTCNKIRVNANE